MTGRHICCATWHNGYRYSAQSATAADSEARRGHQRCRQNLTGLKVSSTTCSPGGNRSNSCPPHSFPDCGRKSKDQHRSNDSTAAGHHIWLYRAEQQGGKAEQRSKECAQELLEVHGLMIMHASEHVAQTAWSVFVSSTNGMIYTPASRHSTLLAFVKDGR